MQGFLYTLTKMPWPKGADNRRCVYTNQTRAAKTWEGSAPALKNHTGPAAPHVFRFQRRGCCAPAVLARMRCMEPLGVAPHDNDVVLFCKRWMADNALSQRPLVVMPVACAPHGHPPIHMARASITPPSACVRHMRVVLVHLRVALTPLSRGLPWT